MSSFAQAWKLLPVRLGLASLDNHSCCCVQAWVLYRTAHQSKLVLITRAMFWHEISGSPRFSEYNIFKFQGSMKPNWLYFKLCQDLATFLVGLVLAPTDDLFMHNLSCHLLSFNLAFLIPRIDKTQLTLSQTLPDLGKFPLWNWVLLHRTIPNSTTCGLEFCTERCASTHPGIIHLINFLAWTFQGLFL